MVFGRVETESLIREVKKRQILWDHSGEHYYDKPRKYKAWVEVCGVLFIDFKTMEASRQKVVLRDVMGRWRTIRDNFVRKRKKLITNQQAGPKAKKMKKYIFDDQLSFLKRISGRRSSLCSSTNSSNVEQQNSQHSECYDTKDLSLGEQTFTEQSLPDEILPDQSIPDQGISITSIPQSPKREIESPSPIEDGLIEFMEKHEAPQIRSFDEDMSFFLSLLPSVKKLNTMQKFDFRLETMRFLQNQLRQRSKEAAQTKPSSGFHFAEFSANEKMFLPEND